MEKDLISLHPCILDFGFGRAVIGGRAVLGRIGCFAKRSAGEGVLGCGEGSGGAGAENG